MSLRQYIRRPSAICVCGRKKENRNQRYCNRCGKFHGTVMRLSHVGKGVGPRTSRLPL